MLHEIKIWPKYFEAKLRGFKPWEIRKNDRNYQVGDYLAENEYDPVKKEYTGRKIVEEITYILDDCGYVPEGYIIMTTKPAKGICGG